jgi:hypothetical protein
MNSKLIQNYYFGKEYKEKLTQRAENLKLISADSVNRNQMMYDIYGNDFEGFCENFLFLMIPEFADSIKPFFLFDYQRMIIHKLRESESSGRDVEILIDKPRGMGLTWLMVAYFVWKWMFQPNWTAFILSRTENEVDDGSQQPGNSIMSKVRWMLARLPSWSLPDGFKLKVAKGNENDSTLKIINPMIKSGIFGSSTNSNAGRSRRYSLVFIDECFSIEKFTEVHRSLMSVARVQVYVSTTKASREAKAFKDSITPNNYISLDWKDHPWKDEEWYQEQLKKAEFDPEIMKEIDKGYSLPAKSQYYPEIIKAKIAPVLYNRELPIYCGLDFGKGDLTVMIWFQFDGDNINVVECYWNKNKGKYDWYAPFLNTDNVPDFNYQYSPAQLEFIDKLKTWKKPALYFGEAAHAMTGADNQSIVSVLAKKGIRIYFNPYGIQHEPRRIATSMLLPKMVFNESSENVLKLYDAIANSRYSNTASSKNGAMKPMHDDEIADFRAAMENFCVNVGRIFKHQREQSSMGTMNEDNFIGKMINFLRV